MPHTHTKQKQQVKTFEDDIYDKVLRDVEHTANQNAHDDQEIAVATEQVRNFDWPIKMFYSLMRIIRSYEGDLPDIVDIGSSSRSDPCDAHQADKEISLAHQKSLAEEEYHTYPSSWGLPELRSALGGFAAHKWGISVNEKTEVMITGGTTRGIDMVLQAFDRPNLYIPEWSPYFVRSLGLLRKKNVFEVPVREREHAIDLAGLERHIASNSGKGVLYLSNPLAPLGMLLDEQFIQDELISFAQKHDLIVVSDTYVFDTCFKEGACVRPFMSYSGADSVGVELLTLAKEFGLPGIRVGGAVGGERIINALRLYASAAVEMVPTSEQRIAAHALRTINTETVARRVISDVRQAKLVFDELEWPIKHPEAGLDMMVRVPLQFQDVDFPDASLLFSIYLLVKYGVGMAPASIYTKNRESYLMVFVKQHQGDLVRALSRLQEQGFSWENEQPSDSFVSFAQKLVGSIDTTNL